MKITMPDGIVTVHLDDKRYRGSYLFDGDKLVVKAHGLETSSADMAVLGGERGNAALNLAKLVLVDMVRDAQDIRNVDAGLSLQGSTTRTICGGSTTSIGY
jgi:hypothetical protein